MTDKDIPACHKSGPLLGLGSSDGLGPKVWARKDQLQHASRRGGLMCAMYPDTKGRADLEPLYDQAARDAAVEQANARQNASWRLMCERMVAAERERIAAHFDERDRGHDGKPLGLGYYEPHEPAEIIRALGPNVAIEARP